MRRAILHITTPGPYASALPPFGPTCVLSSDTNILVIDTETGEILAGLDGVRDIKIEFPMDGFVTAMVITDELRLDIHAEAFIGNRIGHVVWRAWVPFITWLRYRFLPRFKRYRLR